MNKKKKKSFKKPTDVNLLAKSIVDESTSAHAMSAPNREEIPTTKNPAAVALGRLGGLKGGRARAEKLTPKQRKEIARKAAIARWSKKKS